MIADSDTVARTSTGQSLFSDERRYAAYAYIAQIVGVFTAVGFIVALVIDYLAWDELPHDGITAAHVNWQIRTFWWSVAYCVLAWLVGILGAFFIIGPFIGVAIWFAAFIWGIYRIARGFIKLADGQRPKPGYQ